MLTPPPTHTHLHTHARAQSATTNDVTLAVGLFDAGEFVAAHPQGRLLAATTGLADAIRLHLDNPRATMDDVKQQALMAMSKCLQKLSGAASSA